MFKQPDENSTVAEISNPETIIGPTMKVEGDFVGEGDVIVDGEVRGTLKTKQDLKVGEQAVIKADVEAVNALVSGTIEGNLTATENLELTASAQVKGDVSAKVLQVAPGATINGTITMSGTSSQPEPTSQEEPTTPNANA